MSNSGTILSKYTKETYKIDTITDLKIIEKIVKSKDGKKYPIIKVIEIIKAIKEVIVNIPTKSNSRNAPILLISSFVYSLNIIYK